VFFVLKDRPNVPLVRQPELIKHLIKCLKKANKTGFKGGKGEREQEEKSEKEQDKP
jgi:hypothetical protein